MDTILVVDDEYANRFILERVLSDYRCISVPSAEAMWNALAENSVDLIILDVMMPGQNGFEAARVLRSKPEYVEIPIIFVTARRGVEDVAEGFDLGGNDYIKKPFDEGELLTRVKYSLKNRKEKQSLQEIVLMDAGTGLYNKHFLEDHIRRESDKLVRGLSHLSVAMCDIDHFKKINDTYGHPCGDYVLRHFAENIKESIRTYDLAIRYGGEEFLILFPYIRKNESIPVLDRLSSCHAAYRYAYENTPIRFTFSAGISDSSEVVPSATMVDDMIKLADTRLYKAKESGRNRIIAD